MNPVTTLFEAAAEDRQHGAAEVEGRLIDGLLHERPHWTVDALAAGVRRLLQGQPAMANLRSLARSLVDRDLGAVEHRLRRRAATLSEAAGRLAEAAWPWIDGADRVLTISRSSAVAAALSGAWGRGWRGETVVFDGSPAGRGPAQARLLAATLSPVRSLPDAAVAQWLGAPGSLVVVGADAVSPTRLLNVCGTAVLLELARARSVPTIVVADTGKDLADHELDEVLARGPTAEEPGPGRRWPLFETASLALVTTRVHE